MTDKERAVLESYILENELLKLKIIELEKKLALSQLDVKEAYGGLSRRSC